MSSRALSKKRGASVTETGRSKKKAKTSSSSGCKQTSAAAADSPLPNSRPATHGFLSGVEVFILQAGLGKARAEIFGRQLKKFGGAVHDKFTEETKYIIVDELMEIDRLLRILKVDAPPANVKIVKASWLSSCLSEERLLETGDFELDIKSFLKLRQNKADEKDEGRKTEVRCKLPESRQKVDTVVTETEEKDENAQSTDASEKQSRGVADEDERSEAKPSDGQVFVPVRRHDSDDSSYEPSDDEDYASKLSKFSASSSDMSSAASSSTSTPNTSPQKLPKGNWVCAKAVTNRLTNHNKHITDKLAILMETYKNTKDQWRALSYSKAIMALKNYPKEITSWEEANNIPGIGQKLADKVWEIVQSGHLRKIDHVCQGEDVATINLFNKIHGVGPTVARDFYQQGFRTIDDLREKAKLSRQQKIGLKHFDDFLDRMQREEATEIEKVVVDMAHSINPGLIGMACGSYRRGKPTCGDVDVLITHPDGHSHKGVFQKLLEKLRATGFITDDLVSHEDSGEQKKYLGVCKLPGENRKHRRLDIIVVPYHEYPCAIMYFTGSSHFNRSMRALAGKKGMSLNEHALKSGVIRKGREKINEGVAVPVKSEEDVFRILGLEYRTPVERDW
ncbi:DNA polymerase lambda-like [Ptychodera flava]|uniref:DNA polymerase lambda-like n=1 Tax=Ptychodera flava TaxID=63121 RepID=UPI003969EE42